jgi:hypothetical protein
MTLLINIQINLLFKRKFPIGLTSKFGNLVRPNARAALVLSVSPVEGEKTGDGISYAAHVKNANPLKARATTFYDPVHHALDKEAKCAWKEGEGNHWPSVYIQKPFMTL